LETVNDEWGTEAEKRKGKTFVFVRIFGWVFRESDYFSEYTCI